MLFSHPWIHDQYVDDVFDRFGHILHVHKKVVSLRMVIKFFYIVISTIPWIGKGEDIT